jgi:hypothetical protein
MRRVPVCDQQDNISLHCAPGCSPPERRLIPICAEKSMVESTVSSNPPCARPPDSGDLKTVLDAAQNMG